jgi:glycyl-tRNA synthetase beta chain
MTPSATVLVELRTEELPPKSLKRLGEAFAHGVVNGLRERDCLAADSTVRTFATPRRLAVSITNVLAVAPDKPFREKLLPVSVVFVAAGKPTAALHGKLKAKQLTHLDPATLPREHDGKTEVLYYAAVAKGGPLVNALQSALESAQGKSADRQGDDYGSAGRTTTTRNSSARHTGWSRCTATTSSTCVPSLTAGRVTAGHRFSAGPTSPSQAPTLTSPRSRQKGRSSPISPSAARWIVTALGARRNTSVIMPDALLDEVTALVEWPAVYARALDSRPRCTAGMPDLDDATEPEIFCTRR